MALGFLEPRRDHLSLSTTGGLIYFKYRDAEIWQERSVGKEGGYVLKKNLTVRKVREEFPIWDF